MENNKNIKEITIKIEGKEWEKALDKAFEEANKKAKIDGFRPGKAPKDVFIKKYGKESLFLDAADLTLQTAYTKMLEENKDLELVAQPQVNLKSIDENYCEFTFVLTTRPEVKLGKYKKLGVKKEEIEITQEEIDHTILEMRNRYAENVSKDGSLDNGDLAIIDFEGFKDDVAFEGGKGENYSLTIGSNTFIPGFEEQLIGMNVGEEKNIEVTFPDDYHSEDLKGAKATFKVKLNEIKQTIIPEINEEFFEDLGMEGITTKEALEAQVKDNIKTHKEAHVEDHFIDSLLVAACENMEVEIPEEMINEELNRMIKQYEENLKMQGITLAQFYQFTNSDEEALKTQMKEEGIKRVKSRLLLEEIAKAEKIEVTQEETDKEAESLAAKYNMKKDEFLNLFGGEEMVKYDLEMRKAIEILKDNN
ncbi:MAG: trigger factor [Bacilli bacterium]|nr:trigger factor [Bacilli bacterium]